MKQLIKKYCFVYLFLFVAAWSSQAQPGPKSVADEQILYSDLNSWWSRAVSESRLIGGEKVVYSEPGPDDEQYQSITGTLDHLTPWASSNVRAEVGVSSANESVYPEKRGEGYCARLETNLKKVVVLGIVNVKAIASGSLFLGQMEDPITNPDNPRRNTLMGIPFNSAPSALSFDYKVQLGEERLRASGGFRVRKVDGPDQGEVYMLLQNRTEDTKGNLTVKRIGTAWHRFDTNQPEWINNYQVPVIYGDATKDTNYQPYMDLISSADPYYALNSSGERVAYTESGWSTKKEEITHIVLVFSASYEGGSFIGSPDSKLWIDNIQMLYDR